MNQCAAPVWNGREVIKNTDQAMRGIFPKMNKQLLIFGKAVLSGTNLMKMFIH